jgi:hypothetical protein
MTLTCSATPRKSAFGMPDPGSDHRVGGEHGHDEVVPGLSRVTARPTIALPVARNGLGRAVQQTAPVTLLLSVPEAEVCAQQRNVVVVDLPLRVAVVRSCSSAPRTSTYSNLDGFSRNGMSTSSC